MSKFLGMVLINEGRYMIANILFVKVSWLKKLWFYTSFFVHVKWVKSEKKAVFYSMKEDSFTTARFLLDSSVCIYFWMTFPTAQCSGWVYYEILKCH